MNIPLFYLKLKLNKNIIFPRKINKNKSVVIATEFCKKKDYKHNTSE